MPHSTKTDIRVNDRLTLLVPVGRVLGAGEYKALVTHVWPERNDRFTVHAINCQGLIFEVTCTVAHKVTTYQAPGENYLFLSNDQYPVTYRLYQDLASRLY